MNVDDIRPMKGIALKVLHVAMYMVMLTIIKAVEGVPNWELMFFRVFFAILPIAVYLGLKGELRASLKTKRHGGHLLRHRVPHGRGRAPHGRGHRRRHRRGHRRGHRCRHRCRG